MPTAPFTRALPLLAALVGCGQPAPSLAPADPAPEIAVAPTVRDLPANALVFRAIFPEPITLGPHAIHVRDASGTIVPGAVRRVVWDQAMREVTIPLEGLDAGALYTLRLEGLETQAGAELASVERVFVVLPTDDEPPAGAAVRVEGLPRAGGREPLRVAFPEPVQASSLDSLTVLAGGAPAEGIWALAPGDDVAVFTPEAPWGEATVRVALGAGIRDLAGNELADRPEGMLVPVAPRSE